MAHADTLQDKSLKRFQITKEDKGFICKYFHRGTGHISVSDGSSSPIFRNVKRIFFREEISAELKAMLGFEKMQLARLSACITDKNIKHSDKDEPAHIPIYIPKRDTNFRDYFWQGHSTWPETEDAENLFIEVSIDQSNNALFQNKVGIFRTRFYRAGFDRQTDSLGVGPQCVSVFPFLEDKEQSLQQLTKAANSCLNFEYYYGAVPTP